MELDVTEWHRLDFICCTVLHLLIGLSLFYLEAVKSFDATFEMFILTQGHGVRQTAPPIPRGAQPTLSYSLFRSTSLKSGLHMIYRHVMLLLSMPTKCL